MRVFRDETGDDAQTARLPNDARGAVWAIGNFDGLHRGHRALLTRAWALARERHALAGVLTFTPHPARTLNPELAPPLILTEDEKEVGLAELGMDLMVALRFDARLAAMSAEVFCLGVLGQRLGALGVVVGEGFRFGHRAQGTVDDLRRTVSFVDVVPAVKQGDLVCSSTKVRELVLEGRVDAAALVLGSPYFLSGTVVQGDMRGRTIGIPTANLETRRELLPKVGVYATVAVLEDGRRVPSVTNIGLRPTFQTGKLTEGVRIETHLLDFEGDLYEQNIRVELLSRIRDEMRFPGPRALVEQIHKDIEVARRVVSL